MLYKKLNIDNYIGMQQEVIDSVHKTITSNIRYWDQTFSQLKFTSPTLHNYIDKNKKLPVRFCRFYLTPSYGTLGPHIDGDFTNKSPLGLNLPIIGCDNTYMNWYTTDNDNLYEGKYGFGKKDAIIIKDKNKLKLINSVIIDQPTFVRTDVLHEVINNKPSPRLVLSIRFIFNQKIGQNFTDVFNF